MIIAPIPANDIDKLEALPVIDEAMFGSLRSRLPASKFAALLRIYLDEAGRQSRQFERWRAELALDAIGDEAHRMISSAGTFGARRVQLLATRLQTACRSGDQASSAALLDELADATEAASSALRQRLPAWTG